MDLRLQGKSAIICASSQGLGLACARALAAEGADVLLNGRNEARLAETVTAVRSVARGSVAGVAADIGTADGRAALLAACPAPDILINNNGGPPPRPLDSLDEAALLDALNANMIAPAALAQSVLPAMAGKGFGRVVNITSVAVRMTVPGLAASTAARAGLSGFMAAAARHHAASGVTVNALLPGYFATQRIDQVIHAAAERDGTIADEARNSWTAEIPAGRLGDPAEFGQICAFLCSPLAAYITGQNILVDGGLFPGVI